MEILDTTEEEIPFIGELIKINPAEQLWEDAIERLLHRFSMQFLVPEKFSKLANHFIYTNDMQARLVYHKVDRRPSNTLQRWPSDDDSLVNKIELKNSDFQDWLETALVERFNYFCTDDLEVFYGSQKAITSNGLMRNVNRHEKDDRPGRWNKSKYRLGWDNRASVQYLQQEKKTTEKEYEKLGTEINQLTPVIATMAAKLQSLHQLTQVKSFHDINWAQHAEKINSLSNQVQELKKSSNAYQLIVDQINALDKTLESEKKRRDGMISALAYLNNDFNDKNRRKLTINFDDLSEEGSKAIGIFFSQESISMEGIPTLPALDALTATAGIKFKARKTAATAANSKIELATTSLIAGFVSPPEKITSEFANWTGDVMNIKSDLSGLDDLEDLYNTILTQRLVEHKRRFRDYMDKSMLDALTSYRTWLYNEETKITDMIEELNIPLRKITFNKNPDTYLQLESRSVRFFEDII